VFLIFIHLEEYKKVELSAHQYLSVCLDVQASKLLQLSVKFPSFQEIYLDQVLADSSKPSSSYKRTLLTLHLFKSTSSFQKPRKTDSQTQQLPQPLSLVPHHSPSSKLIFFSMWSARLTAVCHFNPAEPRISAAPPDLPWAS
ncbi:hypothetical protein ILYODFUR_029931, partial [Ilyodon furcidens]